MKIWISNFLLYFGHMTMFKVLYAKLLLCTCTCIGLACTADTCIDPSVTVYTWSSLLDCLSDFLGIPGLEEAFSQLQPLLECLPSHNHSTLDTILEHLAKVCSYEPQNKMSIQNLAVVFGPTLIRPRHEDIQ